jgi:hypothetical protein
MLTVDEARTIAAEWRPQFAEEASFDESWSRFFSMVGDPSPDRLVAWLSKDQAKDAVKHAGIVKEPLLPTRSTFTATLGDCPHCGGDFNACPSCHGLGYVRRELDIGHPDFGKAIRCPRCTHA